MKKSEIQVIIYTIMLTRYSERIFNPSRCTDLNYFDLIIQPILSHIPKPGQLENCNDITNFGTQLFILKVHDQTRNDTNHYITIIRKHID